MPVVRCGRQARTGTAGRDTNRNPRVKQGLRLIASVRDLIVVGSSEGLQLWPRGLLSGPLPPPPEPLIAGGWRVARRYRDYNICFYLFAFCTRKALVARSVGGSSLPRARGGEVASVSRSYRNRRARQGLPGRLEPNLASSVNTFKSTTPKRAKTYSTDMKVCFTETAGFDKNTGFNSFSCLVSGLLIIVLCFISEHVLEFKTFTLLACSLTCSGSM